MNLNLTLNPANIARSITSPHPLRDWVVVLTLAALGLATAVGVGVYYFFGIQSGTIIGDTSAEIAPAPRLSRAELESIAELYTTRRVNYEQNAIDVPSLADPSL